MFASYYPIRPTEFVTGSATNKVTIGSIPGDSLKSIGIRYRIVNAESASTRDFRVYPNGETDNGASTQSVIVGTTTSDVQANDLAISLTNSRDYMTGFLMLQCLLDRGGGVNIPRCVTAFTHVHDGPPVPTSGVGLHRVIGAWDNVADELTSVELVCTQQGNRAVEFNGFGVGSEFQLCAEIPGFILGAPCGLPEDIPGGFALG